MHLLSVCVLLHIVLPREFLTNAVLTTGNRTAISKIAFPDEKVMVPSRAKSVFRSLGRSRGEHLMKVDSCICELKRFVDGKEKWDTICIHQWVYDLVGDEVIRVSDKDSYSEEFTLDDSAGMARYPHGPSSSYPHDESSNGAQLPWWRLPDDATKEDVTAWTDEKIAELGLGRKDYEFYSTQEMYDQAMGHKKKAAKGKRKRTKKKGRCKDRGMKRGRDETDDDHDGIFRDDSDDGGDDDMNNDDDRQAVTRIGKKRLRTAVTIGAKDQKRKKRKAIPASSNDTGGGGWGMNVVNISIGRVAKAIYTAKNPGDWPMRGVERKEKGRIYHSAHLGKDDELFAVQGTPCFDGEWFVRDGRMYHGKKKDAERALAWFIVTRWRNKSERREWAKVLLKSDRKILMNVIGGSRVTLEKQGRTFYLHSPDGDVWDLLA